MSGGELRDAVQRKASFLQTVRAVGWSFFGIRKGSEYRKDVSQLNPLHVVIAGVAAAGVFVAALVILVNWVIASGVAK
ncbi:MAG: DUF2970 domain-containing protein [Burkholderiaceae bacterium]